MILFIIEYFINTIQLNIQSNNLLKKIMKLIIMMNKNKSMGFINDQIILLNFLSLGTFWHFFNE